MRYALLTLLLAGCASTPVSGPIEYDRGYADGWADGKTAIRDQIDSAIAAERARIIARLERHVGPHADVDLDARDSWLNDHGVIPLQRMAFAREREMRLKHDCIAAYEALADSYRREIERIRDE